MRTAVLTHLGGLRARPRRAAIAAALAAAAVSPGAFGELTREMLVDAYIQVSVFVAATLLIFYGAERLFRFDFRTLLGQNSVYAVPIAAAMGAAPGCGGAVMVVAAYASGNVGFGAVVAALTATMGDAAFLLIAVRPDAAAVVLPVSFAVGILTGWIVNWRFPGLGRLCRPRAMDPAPRVGRTRVIDIAYLAPAIPGLGIGILQLFQYELTGALQSLPTAIALFGVAVGLLIWSTSRFRTMSHADDSPVTRMAEETSFISIWVIGAFLLYEYLAAFAGLNMEAAFQTIAPVLPLAGIVIGFIPGCGPQVLVTTLYINGLIPFAAVLGNAISNDGDALFPAIAVDPRAAVLATAVSGIPAIIVAYAFYFLVPGFLN